MSIWMMIGIGVGVVVVIIVLMCLIGMVISWKSERDYKRMTPDEQREYDYRAYRAKIADDAKSVE